MSKDEIISFLKNNKQELRERFGVIKIGLFGSYVKDQATPDSDIDIVVEIEAANKFRAYCDLNNFLETGLKQNVDLGIESSLKEFVRRRIAGEIVYV